MDITDVQRKHDIAAVTRLFQIYGGFVGAVPYGSGHINDTYRATFDEGGVHVRYIFQRINQGIFKDTPALMENIWRVTTHLAAKRAGEADRTRRVLTLIPTLDGKPYACDER